MPEIIARGLSPRGRTVQPVNMKELISHTSKLSLRNAGRKVSVKRGRSLNLYSIVPRVSDSLASSLLLLP